MFGVSFPELIIVCLVALLVFGPDKLPELMRNVGRFSAQFRRQSDSLRREFYNTIYQPADDLKAKIQREARSLMSEPISKSPEINENQTCMEPVAEKSSPGEPLPEQNVGDEDKAKD